MISTVLDERVATLRERCRKRKLQVWPDKTWVDFESFRSSEGMPSSIRRIGQRTYDRLANLRFELDEWELLVGRPSANQGNDESRLEEARRCLAEIPFASTPGQTGHCELDRRIVMENGLDGALEELEARIGKIREEVRSAPSVATSPVAGTKSNRGPVQRTLPEREETYLAFYRALEGLQAMIEHAARTVEEQIPSASLSRKAELEEIAAICRRCAHLAPQTFREALQLTWLIDLAVSYGDDAWLVSPGHLDRTLIEFYRRDLQEGRLAREEALRLIECYYILINEFVPDGLAVAVMVGGVDREGRDLTNDLSYLCLEAIRQTRLIYPTVGICWHAATPPDLTGLAIELISEGFSTPAFFNDQTIQKGLQKYGIPAEESWNYINSTCVEITPVGASNVWVASPYFSVCSSLLGEIEAAAQDPCPPASFEAFLHGYFARLGRAIGEAVVEQNEYRWRRAEYGGKPLQSVFTRDCIEQGLDIDRGGARYNWIECSFVGLANLVDSLEVIREEIYTKHFLDFQQLDALLKADFSGHERERSRFQNASPKYGHGHAEVDALMTRIVRFVEEECASQAVIPAGTRFVPGAFCWIMHEQLGKTCGATPDGRPAGRPFADGCGPAQGREKYGPTAAILSTTAWDQSPLIGGAAYNMKFNRQLFQNPEGLAGLRDLVLTYLKRGGFETQINVVDRDALRKARVNPELYQDLIVRIGGYTDYFVRLSPAMQEELISRTEYSNF